MKTLRHAVTLAAIFALAGCAGPRSGEKIEVAPAPSPPPYSSTDLGELLKFAERFVGASEAERRAECRRLKELAKANPSLGVRLHWMLAQSVSRSCGEPRTALALIDAALPDVADPKLKAFLIYQKTVLARLDREAERLKSLEKRIADTRSKEKKASRRLESQAGELKELQRKLEALKAIEQSLDEPNYAQ
ncbi:hypothetical protein [Methylomagnum sp.]